MNSLLSVASMFLLGAGVVLALFFAVTRLPGILLQRKLAARLGEVSAVAEDTDVGGEQLIKERHDGLVPSVDRLVAGTSQGLSLARWIEQSGVRVSPSGLLLMSCLCGLVVGFIAATALRLTAGWFAGVFGCAMPFMFLRIKRTRRLRVFEEAFPEALDLVSRALKAGHAFATGLKMVADEMPEPIGPEFRKTFDEQNFGLPLKDALANLTVRVPILDVRFFSTAVLIQRETGGNLSEILENLAHVVRERFKIRARCASTPRTAA